MFKKLLLAISLFFLSFMAMSQELTDSQKSTLKAAILAEPALQQYLQDPRQDDPITAYCNAPATPAKKGWKPSNTFDELFNATDLNVYIARSVAERQAYDLVLNAAKDNPNAVNANRANVRSAIMNIFSGAGGAAVRSSILNAMTSPVSWCENVLGTTPANTDTVTAFVRNWTGTLQPIQISDILNN